MKHIKRESEIEVSFCTEEYIPFKVVLNRNTEGIRNVGFQMGNKSLLEFAVGDESGIIHRVTLVSCENYAIIDDNLIIGDVEDGDIVVNEPDKVMCEYFTVHLYKNALAILVSNDVLKKKVSLDDIVFGFSEQGAFSCLYCKISSKLVYDHIKSELGYL